MPFIILQSNKMKPTDCRLAHETQPSYPLGMLSEHSNEVDFLPN